MRMLAAFEFVIYLWGTPDVEDLEAKAKALADAGFTVVPTGR